ncbi:MAG: iron ABC transporter permease [Roseburia sp.]|nr:iron ABC transporter permease [Anaeroplasma bactoclasticum]MCM1196135.1 iron ABC transporter permease [Roseburia sp.]MCM1557132.1 iron ABC transporter permease [Anaeroplasma bactoclasticum]
MIKRSVYKLIFLLILFIVAICSILISVRVGTIQFSFGKIIKGIFVFDDSVEHLIIFNTRLPRVIIGGLVGICLSLSGCILQGVMRNNLASPSTIGVTSGASFIGYVVLVAFPALSYLLPIGSILGAFITTMLIYLLAYQKGVSPVKMILSGMAVSALFGAFNDIIKTFWADSLGNASGFLVGGLNGVTWNKLYLILPYALIGIIFCIFLPQKMNVLMLGDETANSLGLHTEIFRFVLIAVSSLLAGSAIAVAGLISFVGLIVPHIARQIVGSDYKYLFPTSALLGFILVILCDTIGRVVMPSGEVPVSIIISFIGAPFFLLLLRYRKKG